MSTRNYKNRNDSFSSSTGNEGANIPDDLEIPPCSIEDVDRSLFNLFDEQLPFIYKHKKGTRRAPVIFATGERFAILRRKKPLRDKSGVLILPLISIMRTGVAQSATMGAATSQNTPITIRHKLSKEDPLYQRLLNKESVQNSDDLTGKNSLDSGGIYAHPGEKLNYSKKDASPGKIAKRTGGVQVDMQSRRTKSLASTLGNNIYEIIEIPPPKYFTATYEVTFWAQYTVQMNDMINALMSLYQSFSQRTFQLETKKGYWFVAYMGDNLTPGNNFDDFTDSERLVRYSFDVTVPAYLIGSTYPGAQKTLRRYLSAPQISFDSLIVNKEFSADVPKGIPSSKASDHMLEDLRTIDESLPGQTIAGSSKAHSDSRGIFRQRDASQVTNRDINGDLVGGTRTDDNRTKIIEVDVDPFTGKKVRKKLHVKTRTNRAGETVLRESLD